MRRVVADSGLTLPGLLDPNGFSRKLLVLFAYGRTLARVEEAREELEQARELAAHYEGAEISEEVFEAAIESAKDRASWAREIMPSDAPDDLVLVTSEPLLTELANVATIERLSLPIRADPQLAVMLRRLAASMSLTVFPESEFGDDTPEYTEGRDRDDDMIVHTALLGRCEAIFTKDKHLVTNYKKPQHYQHPTSGVSTVAMKPKLFRQTFVEPFDIDTIDGGLLGQFYAMPSSMNLPT